MFWTILLALLAAYAILKFFIWVLVAIQDPAGKAIRISERALRDMQKK